MVASQDTTQTGLLTLIAELRGKERELEVALEETRGNIDRQRALELLRGRYGLSAAETEHKIDIETLRGKTLSQALIAIAQDNSGLVKVNEAKRVLLEAGIGGKPKTAYQRITSALVRSQRFVRNAPGEYRLVALTAARVGSRPLIR